MIRRDGIPTWYSIPDIEKADLCVLVTVTDSNKCLTCTSFVIFLCRKSLILLSISALCPVVTGILANVDIHFATSKYVIKHKYCRKLELINIGIKTLNIISRLGQTFIWLPRRRRSLVLFVGHGSALRAHLHHRWRYWLRRQPSRQHMLLHKERSPSRNSFQRTAGKSIVYKFDDFFNTKVANKRTVRQMEIIFAYGRQQH